MYIRYPMCVPLYQSKHIHFNPKPEKCVSNLYFYSFQRLVTTKCLWVHLLHLLLIKLWKTVSSTYLLIPVALSETLQLTLQCLYLLLNCLSSDNLIHTSVSKDSAPVPSLSSSHNFPPSGFTHSLHFITIYMLMALRPALFSNISPHNHPVPWWLNLGPLLELNRRLSCPPNETVLALFKCLMIGWQEAGEGRRQNRWLVSR